MKANVNFSAVVVNNEVSRGLTKENVEVLEKNKVIYEDYFMLKQGFNGAFECHDAGDFEMKSRVSKGDTVKVPKFTFKNSTQRFTILSTMLLNALVLDKFGVINTDVVEGTEGLPIWYHDKFKTEFPGLSKLSDYREVDGGFKFLSNYFIVGALVHPAPMSSTSWAIPTRMYSQYPTFLEFEKLTTKNPTLWGIKEERLIQISKMNEADRTIMRADGTALVCPSYSQLIVAGNAKTDIRWSYAQLILAKTW